MSDLTEVTVERFVEVYARLAEIEATARYPMPGLVARLKERDALRTEIGVVNKIEHHPIYNGSEEFDGCLFLGAPPMFDMLLTVGEAIIGALPIGLEMLSYGRFDCSRLCYLYGPAAAAGLAKFVAEAATGLAPCHARYVIRDWASGAILKSARIGGADAEVDDGWSYDFCGADDADAQPGWLWQLRDEEGLRDLCELIEARDAAANRARRGEEDGFPDLRSPTVKFIEERLERVDAPMTSMTDLRLAIYEGTVRNLTVELRNRGFKTVKRGDGKVYVNARVIP